MMGYKTIHCAHLKQKDDVTNTDNLTNDLYSKRRAELVNELVDPICVIANANDILTTRLAKFVDEETKAYFEMISRASTKTKTLVDELRSERISST